MTSRTSRINDRNLHIVLQSLPDDIEAANTKYSTLTHIDEHRIFFLPNNDQYIWSYDVRNNQWNPECMPHCSNWKNITFDRNTNKLYLENDNKITIIHKDTESVIGQKTISGEKISDHFYIDYKMLCVNGCIHFVNRHRGKHFMLKPPSGRRKTWTQFMDDTGYRGTCGGAAVYIPTKNMMLLIGGYVEGDFGEPNFASTSVMKGEHFVMGNYRRNWKRWVWTHSSNNAQAMAAVNAVVTADSKYVIISEVPTGHDYYHGNDAENVKYIHVMDIENDFKWRRTSIKTPLRSEIINPSNRGPIWDTSKQMMFRTGNSNRTALAVCGYVRRLYRSEAFKEMPAMPVVLPKLMMAYWSQELIHWVTDQSHVAIRLQDILNAESNDVPNHVK